MENVEIMTLYSNSLAYASNNIFKNHQARNLCTEIELEILYQSGIKTNDEISLEIASYLSNNSAHQFTAVPWNKFGTDLRYNLNTCAPDEFETLNNYIGAIGICINTMDQVHFYKVTRSLLFGQGLNKGLDTIVNAIANCTIIPVSTDEISVIQHGQFESDSHYQLLGVVQYSDLIQ